MGYTNLDQSSEMIIFESMLTIFVASSIFDEAENWLELKIEPPLAN